MKTIAISQPRYLPSCNYIERILISDSFVILDTVQHQKRAFEHRNKIKTAQGKGHWLTIPIDRKKSETNKILDLKILNQNNWMDRHLDSFKRNYKKTTFYDEIITLLENYYSTEKNKLIDATNEMLNLILDYFNISPNIIYASEYDCWNNAKDDLLVDMAKHFNADTYISGPNGRRYIDYDKFRKQKLKLLFHDYIHPIYNQKWEGFIPYLTIWDMMFYYGKETVNLIKTGCLNEE